MPPKRTRKCASGATGKAPRTAAESQVNLSDLILRSVPSGILAIDGDGIIVAANPGAARILGISERSLRPGVALDDVVGMDDLNDAVHEACSKHLPSLRREIIVSRNGEQREIGLSVSALETPDGFNGVMVLFADITERRNLERSAELNRQLATIGELTAGVVHELRNPLMVISGMAEILMRNLEGDIRNHGSASIIFQEAQNLERAIAQFLSFARPFDVEPGPCEPAALCDRVMQLCTPRAERRAVGLECLVNANVCTAQLDFARAAQAVANIVGNAIDAVAEKTGKVRLAARRDGDDLLFEVTDNGPGIHLQPGEDLFKPFFTRKESGTGLGLAIAHRIISAHHGSIAYHNRPKGGAQFDIRLPIDRPKDW